MAYSKDLRRRALAKHEQTGSSAQAAAHFDVSESWVRRLAQAFRATGSFEPRSSARKTSSCVYDAADDDANRKPIAGKPDVTLAEIAAHVGKPVGLGTVHRTVTRLNLPRKKKSTHAAERDRPDVKEKREAWPARFAGVRARDLVFPDEFGANTKMRWTHGRAAPGERVVATVPHGHYKSLSTVAALTAAGVVASSTDDGGTNAARFAGFVKGHLVPTPRPGQVVVPDNLSAHHNKEARAPVEAAGCEPVHLPAYSPDLNPIEKAFSKVKSALRKLVRRTVPQLLKAIP